MTGIPEMKAQSFRLSLCVARRPTCHTFLWSGVNKALGSVSLRAAVVNGTISGRKRSRQIEKPLRHLQRSGLKGAHRALEPVIC